MDRMEGTTTYFVLVQRSHGRWRPMLDPDVGIAPDDLTGIRKGNDGCGSSGWDRPPWKDSGGDHAGSSSWMKKWAVRWIPKISVVVAWTKA